MTTTAIGHPAALPGFRVVDGIRRLPEDTLRNDVAAFLGPAERGPLGVPVRVEGRRACTTVFGGPGRGTVVRAVMAYFANGGEVAWVVRAGHGGDASTTAMTFGDNGSGSWAPGGPARLSLPGTRLLIEASGPGVWADRTQVRITYRAFGVTGAPDLDVAVTFPSGQVVRAAGLDPAEVTGVLSASGLLVAAWDGPPVQPAGAVATGPAALGWTAQLGGGTEPVVDVAALRSAIIEQAQIGEIALVCIPGLAGLLGQSEQDAVVAELARSAAGSQDRLAVVTVPASPDSLGARSAADAIAELIDWNQRIAAAVPDEASRRALAAYFPPLLAEDLSATSPDPYSAVDPAGHVCGRTAELDRTRGSGWSPANTLITDAVDTAVPVPRPVQELALGLGINLIRPRIGGGLEIWGARTRDPGDGRFLAHRRLLHRIVRGVRRVTEPLVFDVNDQLLRFAVARAVNGLLMEAFRSGALQGLTPPEAYRVRCDDTTNPPEVVDAGHLVCEIEVAPAAPMEFITLRLTLGAEGLLEVVEQ